MFRTVLLAVMVAAQTSSSQCGSSSSSPSVGSNGSPAGSNVLPVVVNGGPTNNALNQLFATVTICAPGSSACQTIGGVLVDTGSVGLRLLSSAVTLALPQQMGANAVLRVFGGTRHELTGEMRAAACEFLQANAVADAPRRDVVSIDPAPR